MKRLGFHPLAQRELDKAVAYYEHRRTGLGLDLEEAVADAALRIQQTPASFAASDIEGVRMFLLGRFPYTVYYQEMDAHIRITAIAHHSRRPNYWNRRLK